MAKRSFREDLHDLRPDMSRELESHAVKRQLALALRALRKKQGLTQKDIELASTLTQPMISRLESPTGPLPNWDTVTRYVAACDGHMLVSFSDQAFGKQDVLDPERREEIVGAIAV